MAIHFQYIARSMIPIEYRVKRQKKKKNQKITKNSN